MRFLYRFLPKISGQELVFSAPLDRFAELLPPIRFNYSSCYRFGAKKFFLELLQWRRGGNRSRRPFQTSCCFFYNRFHSALSFAIISSPRIEVKEKSEKQTRAEALMYGSPPAKDLNFPYPAAGAAFGGQHSEHPESGQLHRRHHHHQMSSSLLRYRSAPTSPLPSKLDTETLFARFLGPDESSSGGGGANSCHVGSLFPPPPPSPQEVNGQQQCRGFPSFAPKNMIAHQHQLLDTEQNKNSSANLSRQSSSPEGPIYSLIF